ncbi:MAG: 2OG-Fe(II) oxygenase [Gammaproteobacteria bacterium]
MSASSRFRSASALFAVGDSIPRLAVRDEDGRVTDLLAALEGRPSALLCLPRPASPTCRQAARRFAELELAVPGLVRALLLPEPTRGSDAAELAALGFKTFVALEPGKVPSGEKTLIYAIGDAGGRTLKTATLAGAQIPQLGARIRAAFSPSAEEPGTPRAHGAPVLMIPDVLPAALCRRLIAHFEENGGHPSGILDLSGPEPEWRPDPAIKRRQDFELEEPALIHELEQAVAARVLPEIRKCFQYVVSHYERFKLVRYDEGSGYFRPHRDNETNDTLYRRFAMTINLNTGDYEGGALNFPEFGSATYRPPAGGAIVFSCSLLHEATDVVRGRRYVLLNFFYNPDDGLTPSAGYPA